jgi:DNA-binding NarL/FixJ family response regulator
LDFLKDLNALHPKQRVLILSMHDEALYATRAIRAGASGYVMKEEPSDVLFAAIRHVLDGGTFMSPRLEKQLMKRFFVNGARRVVWTRWNV